MTHLKFSKKKKKTKSLKDSFYKYERNIILPLLLKPTVVIRRSHRFDKDSLKTRNKYLIHVDPVNYSN